MTTEIMPHVCLDVSVVRVSTAMERERECLCVYVMCAFG